MDKKPEFPPSGIPEYDRLRQEILDEHRPEADPVKRARKKLREFIRYSRDPHFLEGETVPVSFVASKAGLMDEEVVAALKGVAGFSKIQRHGATFYKPFNKQLAIKSLDRLMKP